MSEVTTQMPKTGTVKPTDPQPVIETGAAQPSPQDSQPSDPILGFVDRNSGLGKEFIKIGNEFQNYRSSAIHALPAGFVNHTSNMIGAIQLVGEVLMFKASGNQLYGATKNIDGKERADYFHGKFQTWLEEKHPDLAYSKNKSFGATILKGLNPIIEPARNIVNNALENELPTQKSFGAAEQAEKLSLGQKLKRTVTTITDTKSATKLDLERYKAGASASELAKFPNGKLMNRWQTRATLMGITGMTVAALMPEDKDRPEEVDRLSNLATNHPLQYVGQRVMTALNPLEWWHNKRAFIGLTLTVCGMFTTLAGFRNVSKTGINKDIFEYYVNKPHAINGVITATAGSQLLLGVDSEQGWSRFGSILWARMIFLPKSIMNRYKNSDSAPHFYSAGQAAFQTANITAFLSGGAEKLPDGTVIDQKAVRDEAKRKAREEKEKRVAEKEAVHEVAHGHTKPETASLNAEIHAETSPAISSAVPEVTTVTKPGTMIAANEAQHTPPEKSQEIAA